MKPKWKQHEQKQAKDFQGKVSKGSGNYWSSPSDVKTKDFLIEAKQTDKVSYSISKKTWEKAYEAALFSFRIPLISLLLQDVELIILSKEDFQKLVPVKEN